MLKYEMIHKFACWTVCFVTALLVGCATAPAENGKGAETASGASSAISTAVSSTDEREAIQQKIVHAALTAMAASNDSAAVALSAKTTRLAELEPGKTRTTAEQDQRQTNALRNALRLAESAPEGESQRSNLSFVHFVLANHCAGLINEPLCLERNRLIDYTNIDPDNTYGWLTFASSEFMLGRNMEAQIFMNRAAGQKKLDMHYSHAARIGLVYAKEAARSIAGAALFGNTEVAALMLAGELTMPPFQRFTQMCNPPADGVLPEGRYMACRAIAMRMIELGKTNLEAIVGLRAMERMALGEKKDADAKKFADRLASFQAGITTLWKEKLAYPPTNSMEATLFAEFLDDLILVGERSATVNMQKKFGIGAN